MSVDESRAKERIGPEGGDYMAISSSDTRLHIYRSIRIEHFLDISGSFSSFLEPIRHIYHIHICIYIIIYVHICMYHITDTRKE